MRLRLRLAARARSTKTRCHAFPTLVGRGIWKGQLAFGTGEYKAEESRVGRFSGKIAIVSGAASGMGEMEARIIADEGGKVVLTDVQSALGERVAADIGSSAVFRQHDVADERGWAEVVQLARDTFGPPTVLINNGGVGAYGGIHEIETEYMRRIMEINFMGSFFGIPAAKQNREHLAPMRALKQRKRHFLVGRADDAPPGPARDRRDQPAFFRICIQQQEGTDWFFTHGIGGLLQGAA